MKTLRWSFFNTIEGMNYWQLCLLFLKINTFSSLSPSMKIRKERWLSERPAVFRLQAEIWIICETRESISHRVCWSERLEGQQQSLTKPRGHEKTDTWQSSKERMEEAIKYPILERMLPCKFYVWGKIGRPELKTFLTWICDKTYFEAKESFTVRTRWSMIC